MIWIAQELERNRKHPDDYWKIFGAQESGLRNYGYVEDAISGGFFFPKNSDKFYASYDDYVNKRHQYSRLSGKFFTCEFTKAQFLGPYGIVSIKQKGRPRSFKVSKGYAKERTKADWWYDKKNEIYTNYEFDYDPYCKYKGAPRFWRHPGTQEAFGHEFEWRFPSYEAKIAFAEEVKASLRPCICEKDGSLDDGIIDGPSLEVITPPLPYDSTIIEQLFALAKKHKARAPSDGYAWHVTLNLKNAENWEEAGERFMFIINHPELRPFFDKLARRKSKVNPHTGKNYCQYRESEYYMDPMFWRYQWLQKPVNHYYATFLRQCGDAIELRILKSTVDFSVFQATLNTIRKIWEIAKTNQPINITQIACAS